MCFCVARPVLIESVCSRAINAGEARLERMILVEADDDLATCVKNYFNGRYEVSQSATLVEATAAVGDTNAAVVFAEIDAQSPDQSMAVEQLRKDFPQIKIVLVYLAPPPDDSWEVQMRNTVDILVRKPYSILEIDRAIGEAGKGFEG